MVFCEFYWVIKLTDMITEILLKIVLNTITLTLIKILDTTEYTVSQPLDYI
jgi:hypothetical protein